jgi:acyl carrier protein
MDALAAHRRSIGLSGLSINWGAWSDIGAAAGADVSDLLARKGIRSFSPARGHEALGRLLSAGSTNAIVTQLDLSTWRRPARAVVGAKLMELLAAESSDPHVAQSTTASEAVALRDELAATESGPARRKLVESRIQDHVARVLRLPASRLDARRPFKEMGLDSLTALELRNHLEGESGLRLPATLFWNFPTITNLAVELAARMNVPLDGSARENGDSHRRSSPQESVASTDVPSNGSADAAALSELLDVLAQLPESQSQGLLTDEIDAGKAR